MSERISFSISPSKYCMPSVVPSRMASRSVLPSPSPFSMYSRVRIVDFRISTAATRPLPPFLGSRRCETIKRNAFDRRVRTACWSPSGKTPTMRSMVLEASMVCSVDITRWPVSQASSAISMVSRSRISPTRITLGACRNAARNASAKLGVSECNSRW